MVTAPLTRDDLREELALFRDEIRTHYATKADLSDLKAELKTEIAHQTRWFLGGLVATAGIVVALERLWQ